MLTCQCFTGVNSSWNFLFVPATAPDDDEEGAKKERNDLMIVFHLLTRQDFVLVWRYLKWCRLLHVTNVATWWFFFLGLLRLAAGLGDGLRDELLGEVDDLLEVGLQLQQLRVGWVGGQGCLHLLQLQLVRGELRLGHGAGKFKFLRRPSMGLRWGSLGPDVKGNQFLSLRITFSVNPSPVHKLFVVFLMELDIW